MTVLRRLCISPGIATEIVDHRAAIRLIKSFDRARAAAALDCSRFPAGNNFAIMHETYIQMLEGIMLICFGISWPIDIIHTLHQIKHSSKKSLLFLMLIILGYVAGLTAKCFRSTVTGQPLNGLLALRRQRALADDRLRALLFLSDEQGPRRELWPRKRDEAGTSSSTFTSPNADPACGR